MKRLICFGLLLVASCDDAHNDAVDQPDTTVTAATTTAPRRRAAPPTQFDPRAIKPGDRFGDLTVAQVQLQPATTESGWSGSVKFSGQTEVVGSYRAHFDYPEVKEPCFWLEVGSWHKLPRAQNDQRLLWFCFSNPEQAIEQLGELGTQAHATIVIDDYTTNLTASDVWDTARLMRVVNKEAF